MGLRVLPVSVAMTGSEPKSRLFQQAGDLLNKKTRVVSFVLLMPGAPADDDAVYFVFFEQVELPLVYGIIHLIDNFLRLCIERPPGRFAGRQAHVLPSQGGDGQRAALADLPINACRIGHRKMVNNGHIAVAAHLGEPPT